VSASRVDRAGVALPSDADVRGGAPGLPRLLVGIPARGAPSLREHVALHGGLPAAGGRRRRGDGALIEQVERAGLRGRGGGGFPTGAKLRAVADAGRSGGRSPIGGRPIVVVNAAEGEPASLKDRTLVRSLPHLVLDGGVLAARAVGADEVILCVCETAGEVNDSARRAISERERSDRGGPRIHLHGVPNRYVAGQETALVNLVNGGGALPTFTPPRPFERGVRRRPTLVANAETLAHLALIARHGAEWFRELGTRAEPGSALVTLCGPVSCPGVYEIELGSPLSALVEAAGGARAPLRAALMGGYAGAWVDGGLLRGVALSDGHLAPYGASLGAGMVLLLSSETCPVAELARLTRWLAAQSSGQCGPCVHGLRAIADAVERIAVGRSERGAQRDVARLTALVSGRGACSHPDGVARLVSSALEVFAEGLADHADHGPCAACERPSELPRPRGSASERTGARTDDALAATPA
jgi:NADH:ubiquinone oxidoreductase subunit F (NADH-binding)